ncbi:MAG: YbdK family carboxylate-amine ligase [Actinobacteria bacterium]|nr:YbdK family carboxylate-amine ligase [Actinomycetota bacterium]
MKAGSLVRVREDVGRIFDLGEDLTIGIEEEFQILEGSSLDMANRFDDLKAAGDRMFGEPLVVGELIQSEVEINTGVHTTFSAAREDMRLRRATLAQAAQSLGLTLCSTGVHPFSKWEDQRFIETPHYQRVVEKLRYVAWTNNTFGLHVHVGVKGADRAVALSDSFRSLLPVLLALSASSPFFEGRETGLHSTRAQVFIRSFPRCGIPDIYGDWAGYAEYAQFLFDMECADDATEIWWTIRTHHTYGTLEIRVADAQPSWEDSMAVAGLTVALVAMLMDRYDATGSLPVHEGRFIEENRWRALRGGLDGRLIDLDRRVELPATEVVRALIDEAATAAARLGLERELAGVERLLTHGNSAQRQLRMLGDGLSIDEIHRAMVAETMATARHETASKRVDS